LAKVSWGCAMPADPMEQRTDGRASSSVSQTAPASGDANGYEHKARYGDDAGWTNIVWIIIGILCVCGLAVLPFLR